MTDKATYTVAELAELFQCSESHARKMLSDKGGDFLRIPHVGPRRVLTPAAPVNKLLGLGVNYPQTGEVFS